MNMGSVSPERLGGGSETRSSQAESVWDGLESRTDTCTNNTSGRRLDRMAIVIITLAKDWIVS